MAQQYKSLTVNELKELLSQRNIDFTGRNKKGLVQLLEADDAANTVDSDSGSEIENASQISLNTGISGESRSDAKIRELQLQLEIEKVKLQQMQVGSQQGGATGNAGACESRPKLDLPHWRISLPRMTDDSDIIAFFCSWEKAAIVNEIDREIWAKILPSYLSSKALKVFGQLSLEQCAQYETIKGYLCDFSVRRLIFI